MLYSKQTYSYKRVSECNLHADVYRLEGHPRRPAILWIHGGGLVFGNRGMIPSEQIELYLSMGYTLISIDYRLAPETKLKEILEDVQDAYHWVHGQGPQLFGVDPHRLILIGHSSGGYLALLAGLSVSPRPKAIVSFYGYGDITGEWCTLPDPYYTKEPIVSPETAYLGVGKTELSGSHFTGLTDKRWLFYLFCRQQGLWVKEITGHDPLTEPKSLDPFCPVRHITQDYPATLLLHGDQDKDVPLELSQQMAASLKEHRVRHELILMKGFGHLFDLVSTLPGGSPTGLKNPQVIEAFNSVQAFLKDQT